MTVTEYAALHKVSDRTVYRWIENGKISAEKRQGVWFILDENENNSSADNGDNLDKKDNNIDKDGDISDNGDNPVIDLLQHKIQSYEIQIEQLKSENGYLRQELTQASETIAETQKRSDDAQKRYDEAQQRHDTIVMSISNQLAEERKKLEDMRSRKLWRRIKTAFSFASS